MRNVESNASKSLHEPGRKVKEATVKDSEGRFPP